MEFYILQIFCQVIKCIFISFVVTVLLISINFPVDFRFMRLALDSHLEVTLENLFSILYCSILKLGCVYHFGLYCSA